MKKIEVNDAYIDRVVEYLNELEGLRQGEKPPTCGMCVATECLPDGLLQDCDRCPLLMERVGYFCYKRSRHLRDSINGEPINHYSHATKESILKRVKWIADMVNQHTTNPNGWIVEVGDER